MENERARRPSGGALPRNIGTRTELAVFKIVQRFFPGVTRTRVGEHGTDLDPGSMHGRAVEITRVDWSKISTKRKQVEKAAKDCGATEWVILKVTAGKGATPPYYWAVQDMAQYLANAAELDQLRKEAAARLAALAAPGGSQ